MRTELTAGWWKGVLPHHGGVPKAAIAAFRPDLAAKWFRETQRIRSEIELRHLKSVFAGAPLDVLDVGAGIGIHSLACQWLGHRVTTTDRAGSKFLPILEALPLMLAEYTIGKDDRLPFEDASFDVVLCLSLLIKREAPFRALIPGVMRELARVLRPGGEMLVGWWKANAEQCWLSEFMPPDCIAQDVSQGYSPDPKRHDTTLYQYHYKLIRKP